ATVLGWVVVRGHLRHHGAGFREAKSQPEARCQQLAVTVNPNAIQITVTFQVESITPHLYLPVANGQPAIIAAFETSMTLRRIEGSEPPSTDVRWSRTSGASSGNLGRDRPRTLPGKPRRSSARRTALSRSRVRRARFSRCQPWVCSGVGLG